MSEKIAILGDIHSNWEAFQVVLAKAQKLGATKYVCLGDIVGYNADPKLCLDKVRELDPIAIVKGNHDEYIGTDQELLGFNKMASCAVKWTRNQLSQEDRQWLARLPYTKRMFLPETPPFLLVHATLDNPSMWGYIFNRFSAMSSMEYQGMFRICFCGHTHVPNIFVSRETAVTMEDWPENAPFELRPNIRYLFNIGSVGQPRDNDPRAAFVMFEPEKMTMQLYRLEYDIETTQRKIREAGLPETLAERLAMGK